MLARCVRCTGTEQRLVEVSFRRRRGAMSQSTMRTMPGGRAIHTELPTGANGLALCRWCSLEVPPRRRTFCSEYCVNEWRLRTDPRYLRERVLARDRGVCALCTTDTLA